MRSLHGPRQSRSPSLAPSGGLLRVGISVHQALAPFSSLCLGLVTRTKVLPAERHRTWLRGHVVVGMYHKVLQVDQLKYSDSLSSCCRTAQTRSRWPGLRVLPVRSDSDSP